jgi:hypothetical protein
MLKLHLKLNRVFFVFQLQKLKVEPVLLHYLSRLTILQGIVIQISDTFQK